MAPQLISVVVPVYGCSDCLPTLHGRLTAVLKGMGVRFEIILVNDASPDGAWDTICGLCARDARVRALDLSRNFGQHSAISAGLNAAAGSHVVVMDCDLQDDPAEIPALYAKISEGYDAVLCQRSGRRDTPLKKALSRAFYRILSHLTQSRLDPDVANFGMYSAAVVRAVNSMGDKVRFFPLMVQWVGFKTARIPVRHGERHSGHTSYSLKKLVRLAANVAMTFSDKPLVLIVNAGFAVSGAAAAYGLYVVTKALTGGVHVPGWSSLILSVWFLGGAQMAVAGIVGLYVGKTFEAAKARPVYVVRETRNFARPFPHARRER